MNPRSESVGGMGLESLNNDSPTVFLIGSRNQKFSLFSHGEMKVSIPQSPVTSSLSFAKRQKILEGKMESDHFLKSGLSLRGKNDMI